MTSLKSLSTIVLSVVSIAAVASACAPRSSEPVASNPGASAVVTPEVHTWTSADAGFHTHSHWIDTGAEVVVFDAQFTPDLAREVVADIEAHTDHPITTLVVTHPNPDKFNGASVFQDLGAEVVASRATADALPGVHAYKKAYFTGVGMFTADTYPSLPSIDRTFEGDLTLDTAVPVRLVELDHGGVTTTQTVAIVGDALFVGDLTAGRAHAWLEGGIQDGMATPDLAEWDAALEQLGTLAAADALVYPGRGESLSLDVAVSEQRAYLAVADAVVSDYVAQLDDPMAALTGPDAGDHYAAITEQMVAERPDHDLAYLVTYGVYGLALARAAE
jgi:glyoxylase-like metal-dependent hydrolase (beta-lactamase superfamily II)